MQAAEEELATREFLAVWEPEVLAAAVMGAELRQTSPRKTELMGLEAVAAAGKALWRWAQQDQEGLELLLFVTASESYKR